MPNDSRDPMAILLAALSSRGATVAGPAGVSRRAVLGAAWAVPAVAMAVAAPHAAASDSRQPDASLFWSEPEGVQGQSSLLTLVVPNLSPGVGSTATIVLIAQDDGPTTGSPCFNAAERARVPSTSSTASA